jgi:hypothetical protein
MAAAGLQGRLIMKPFIARLGALAATGMLAGGLVLAVSGPAFATGQPNQSCQDVVAAGGTEPGNAANAPGSAFNENGGTAGGMYAGSGVSLDHANSPNAVSQYDVACANQP